MTVNTTWAISEPESFIARCQEHTGAWNANRQAAHRSAAVKAVHDDVIGRMPIIEQIAEESWPDWRNHLPRRIGGLSWDYDPLLQVARQVMVMLKRKDELEQNLGAAKQTAQVSQPVLHPLIELQASPQLKIGKLDHAVFASMKAVEVRVRKLGGFGDDVFGVDLMNKAFGPNAPLTDASAAKGEQEGTRALFAGTYAVLRNPAGHREIDYNDASEAIEAVGTASLLMRILDRVEGRLDRQSPG
jgi:uncharacterized protein (TIGR02391 family)